MTLLKVSGIRKQEGTVPVLNGVSFSQQPLQKIAIAGETGSGKSTLLKIIAGLVQPDAGEVLFAQKRVTGPAEKLVPGHPEICYLSQHFELPRFLRVEQVLSYVNALTADDAAMLYDVCQISHLMKRKTDQLSGGERQRIAMARLLTEAPRLFLLDEPFSNLDMPHKNTLRSVIRDAGESLDITWIMVSHDPADTLSWADEILVMKDGRIVQQAPPGTIYRQPVSEYVAGLFGKYNLIAPELAPALAGPGITLQNGKRLLIRPEDLKIARKGNGSLKGRITTVNFFGGYYETEVLLAGSVITVRTHEGGVSVGSEVYVCAGGDGVWWGV